MNAYEEMLKGIKYVLDNCTAYRVSKDLNINARTVNRYQNGTSPIKNMSLETAGKFYKYYKEEMKMNVEFVYKGYNTRRYSKPWGAKIKLSGNKLEYDFSVGNYLGDGAGGAVVIECNVGDVVATGQRDGRGGNTKHEIYIVKEGGELESTDRKGAYDHLESIKNKEDNPLEGFTDEELLTEIKRRDLLNE